MPTNSISKFIEDFSELPLEDKEYVIDVARKQIMEAKREAIARRAKQATNNLKKARVRKGTVKSLYADLESD